MVGPSLRFAVLLVAFAVAGGAAAVGCNQGIGERCEVDRDCQGGLFCDTSAGGCKPNGTGPSDGGTGGTAGMDASPEAAGDTASDATTPDSPAETAGDVAAEAAVDSPTETPPTDAA